uniref:Uncharacterized protein n=1 Tax=Desertifilum tharense IPPAS B-1220 TaxID=1781255 RepID=A0ACD5GS42_9CYAN
MFDGVDKIQHQAWRFLDPKLLSENPSAWERRMCNLCLEYFRQLDGYIRALVTLAVPGCSGVYGTRIMALPRR